MSLARVFAQRIAIGFVAIWSLLTLVFSVFQLTEDWALARRVAVAAYGGGLTEEQIEMIRAEYFAARGLNRSNLEIYIDWMTNMFTLQWGRSFQTHEPVLEAVMSATATTATYIVPAIAIAMIIGLLIGVYAALFRDSHHAGILLGVSYLGLGIPFFWIAVIVLTYLRVPLGLNRIQRTLRPTEMPFLYSTIFPMILIALVLTAAIVSYSRSYSLQYVTADLTKMVKAKGGGTLDVARHVVRNAAIPLVSLVFTETFALLALTIFVIEALFGIDGLGLLIYNAVWERDLPMILGASLVIVSVGVLSNILQDIAYSALDPRVDTGTR